MSPIHLTNTVESFVSDTGLLTLNSDSDSGYEKNEHRGKSPPGWLRVRRTGLGEF
jgi:hypothetical protein